MYWACVYSELFFIEFVIWLRYNVLMSTFKNNITAKRIAILATKNERLFHIKDLANLWNIQNKNTLRVTLKRYADEKLIYRIYRGFYSLSPIRDIDPILLGVKALHGFCYLSTETVLYHSGYISQVIDYNTFVSSKSLSFTIGETNFKSRQLSDKYLYNPDGISMVNEVLTATPERAICDMLYFNSNYNFDKPVDWEKIRSMQKKIQYPLTPHRYVAT